MNQHENLIARAERAMTDASLTINEAHQRLAMVVPDLLKALKDVIVERDLAHGNFCQLRDDADLSKVTRVHVVPTLTTIGRRPEEFWADHWRPVLQDEGRTLKIFGTGTGDEARRQATLELADELNRIHREGP